MKTLIRPARIEDAEHILRAHFNSVHGTGSKFYSKEICDEWSPSISEKRIKGFADTISSGVEIMFVAIVEDKIAGFSSIIPKDSELRAVYVDPKFGGKGVGKMLLNQVELEARKHGLQKLVMPASLSAEAFYKRHGYIEIQRIEHILKSGKKMPAVKMEKVLA